MSPSVSTIQRYLFSGMSPVLSRLSMDEQIARETVKYFKTMQMIRFGGLSSGAKRGDNEGILKRHS